MPSGPSDATVLVVDDEESVADVYELRLRGEYETRVAYGGESALETVDDDVDVVLLDRRMPAVTGDEVLARIRDRGLDARVIMLTAVDPDFDILEMDFDDYLCKPVGKDDLVGAIDQQLTAMTYDERLTEYLEVSSKRALLETEKTAQELDDNEEFQRIAERAATLETELEATLAEFADFEAAFEAVGRQPG